jgi:cell division protein FtsQ
VTATRQAAGSASSQRRFARRQWARRWARIVPVLVALGVLGVVAFGVWVVAFSPLLDARTVTVRGLTSASALSAGQVRTAARVPLLQPMVRVDLDAIHDRVGTLRPVRQVVVHRSWPHDITIEITERTAVAAWSDGKVRWLVDMEGVPFRTAGKETAEHPQIVLHSPGAEPAESAALRAAGAKVADALPAKLARRVTAVEVRSLDAVTLQLGGGVTVMWGSADDSPTKARVLDALLQQKATVYDVSVPKFPTTKA